jgi:hypothetical protein
MRQTTLKNPPSIANMMQMRQRGDATSFNTVNQLNAHPKDHMITFYEPTHKYTVKGLGEMPISVSGFIEFFLAGFDAMDTLGKMYSRAPPGQSETWRMPFSKSATATNKYAGKTIFEAGQMWENANLDGTALHACIEHYFNCIGLTPSDEIPYDQRWKYITSCPSYDPVKNRICCEQFLKADGYMHAQAWRIYRYEWNIFSVDYHLCGGVDAVYRRINPSSGKQEFVIVDWKRSDTDFKKNQQPKWNKQAYYPFEDFPNTKFTHHQIQVNTYKVLLKEYGISPATQYIFQFDPTKVSYELHTMQSIERDVVKALKIWLLHREYQEEIKRFCTGEDTVKGLSQGVILTRSSLLHPEYGRPVYKPSCSTKESTLPLTQINKRQRCT